MIQIFSSCSGQLQFSCDQSVMSKKIPTVIQIFPSCSGQLQFSCDHSVMPKKKVMSVKFDFLTKKIEKEIFVELFFRGKKNNIIELLTILSEKMGTDSRTHTAASQNQHRPPLLRRSVRRKCGPT